MPAIYPKTNHKKADDYVAVPRRVFEEFLGWQERAKSTRTFKPTATEKKALARAKRNFTKGNYLTWEEVKHELDGNH